MTRIKLFVLLVTSVMMFSSPVEAQSTQDERIKSLISALGDEEHYYQTLFCDGPEVNVIREFSEVQELLQIGNAAAESLMNQFIEPYQAKNDIALACYAYILGELDHRPSINILIDFMNQNDWDELGWAFHFATHSLKTLTSQPDINTYYTYYPDEMEETLRIAEQLEEYRSSGITLESQDEATTSLESINKPEVSTRDTATSQNQDVIDLAQIDLNGEWYSITAPIHKAIITGSHPTYTTIGTDGNYEHTCTMTFDGTYYHGRCLDTPGKCCNNQGEMWVRVIDQNSYEAKSRWRPKADPDKTPVTEEWLVEAGWAVFKREKGSQDFNPPEILIDSTEAGFYPNAGPMRNNQDKDFILDVPTILIDSTEAGFEITPFSDEMETSNYWLAKGDELMNMDRYAESIEYYDEAVKIDPGNAIAWNNRGLASAKMGRFEEALQSFERAVKVEPKYAIAWSNKGLTLNNLGRYDQALDCYNKAIEIDSAEADAWSNKGLTLSNLGRNNEAMQCFDKALEINPKHADALNARCMNLINIGRYNDATQNCDLAIEIRASHFEAWNNRGVAQKKLGRYNEAIESFDAAIGINPNWAIPWYNKGNVLTTLGRIAEANEAYTRAKELGYTG